MIHIRTIAAMALMFIAGYASVFLPELYAIPVGVFLIVIAVLVVPHAETVADELGAGGQI